MRKIVILVIIAGLVAAGVYGYTRWRASQAAAAVESLQTTPAENGELVASIGATGMVRTQQSVILPWQTTGRVEEIFANVGDEVNAGDKLAQLAQTSLPQAVITAQAELVNARKALDDLDAGADTAVVNALQAVSTHTKAVRNAQYQLDNFSVPTEMQSMTAVEALQVMQVRLDEARAAFEPVKYYSSGDERREDLKEQLDEAQADYDTAIRRLEYEYSLEVAQSNLNQALSDYEKWKNGPDPDEVAALEARIAAAEATLALASIEAPIDGVITLVDTQPGDQVTVGSPAFRVDDLSRLLVDLTISEVDINQIQPGQQVILSFDAVRGKEYHGVVTSVDQVGTLNQGAVEFAVEVELEDADQDVRPGMTAAVNVTVNQLIDVLLVPNRAVRFRDGESVVYVLKDGLPTPIEVELGASSDTSSQVIGGELKEGDLIVLNPAANFEGNGPPPFVRGGGQ